ncbi:MAG: pilus assembly protein [Planctomycetes bacterium]|nr:pilus assembly protein [Planctomycetota bacterium]
MTCRQATRRRGAVATEAAVVYPVLFLLLFGLIVGGLGVSRYQQVAFLARETARRVSTQGSDWAREATLIGPTAQTSPTADQVRTNIVLPLAVGLEHAQLTVQVQLVNGATGQVLDWDSSHKAPTSLTASGEPVANRVRVTVTYSWYPGLFLTGPLTLKSISEIPMSF